MSRLREPAQDPATATPAPIDDRLKISALWVSMAMVFAYVDIFGLFRADMLAGIARGQVAGMAISQTFLVVTTVYILIPSLMVALTLFLPRRVNRWANAGLALVYILTIAASCIGETWAYYLLGSAVEIVILLILARLAWRL